MVKRVLKRDGRRVDFNNQKIVAAILKAMDVTENGEDIVLAAQIAHAISTLEKEEMTVEEIQDVVENLLMNSPRPARKWRRSTSATATSGTWPARRRPTRSSRPSSTPR